MSTLPDMLNRLCQPEYTGENRCLPCTLLNSGIALVLAAGIAVLWPLVGVLTLVLFLATIYFRGYLVPGTPELTQRYLPARVLELFGKESLDEQLQAATADGVQPDSSVNGGPPDPEETEAHLRSAGVVEDCAEEDDLCLTNEFREVWWERIRRFRENTDRAAGQLAVAIDVSPAALEFTEQDGYFGVTFEDELIARWHSDAAFYADLAAEPTLGEWLPAWGELDDRQRTELLAGMRAFLETCPACDAELEPVENTRRTCCSGELVSVSVDCPDCGARVFSGSYA